MVQGNQISWESDAGAFRCGEHRGHGCLAGWDARIEESEVIQKRGKLSDTERNNECH
jgi:hypothetical protein